MEHPLAKGKLWNVREQEIERERERLIGQNLGTLGRNEADCCLSMTFVGKKDRKRSNISDQNPHTHISYMLHIRSVDMCFRFQELVHEIVWSHSN